MGASFTNPGTPNGSSSHAGGGGDSEVSGKGQWATQLELSATKLNRQYD